MKKIRILIASLSAVLFTGMAVLAPAPQANALFEGAKEQACNGASLQEDGGCVGTADEANRVSNILKAVLNIMSFVVGVVAVIMLIIGGIRFVTSQGEGRRR
jgi:hypothetical protein